MQEILLVSSSSLFFLPCVCADSGIEQQPRDNNNRDCGSQHNHATAAASVLLRSSVRWLVRRFLSSPSFCNKLAQPTDLTLCCEIYILILLFSSLLEADSQPTSQPGSNGGLLLLFRPRSLASSLKQHCCYYYNYTYTRTHSLSLSRFHRRGSLRFPT